MSRISIGGDPESYMDAPQISVGGGEGGGGGGGFIASLLDLLGIHREVAKGPKKSKKNEETTATSNTTAPPSLYTPPVPVLPVLGEAEAIFGIPGMPTTSAFRPTEVPKKIDILDPNLLR